MIDVGSSLSDTKYLKVFNMNPKNKKTTDCVVRAIALATNQSWEKVLRDLCEIAIETGYHIDDVKCYAKYIESCGFTKCKQPRKPNNKKYTGKEFCQYLYDNKVAYNKPILAHIGGHHIVAIMPLNDKGEKRFKVVDIWDSTDGTIGNFWMIK